MRQINKIGICEWYLPCKGTEAISLAAAAGFNGIQIADQGIKALVGSLTRKEVCRIYRQSAEERGVTLQAYALTGIVDEGGLCQPEESAAAEEMRLQFHEALEDCRAMGIDMMIIIGMGKSCPADQTEFQRTCSQLQKFVREALPYGIRIVYESYMDIGKTCDLLEAVPDLQLLYDTLNPIRRGFGDPMEDIGCMKEKALMGRIGAVHIKDMPQSKVGTMPFGKGCADPEEKLKALQAAGYCDWIVSENSYAKPPMTDFGTAEENVKFDCEWLRERICK